jgi:predicted AlkP superfamily phosphohydrolase/phosphomutase/Flp pilus assembly protein TadD
MSRHRRILLLGWDAADWRLINPLLEAGKMPALESLINRGVMGNLATIRPMLSPMLWTSIATGKRAYQHGIHGFAEPTADGAGIQPISNLSRKAKAFWNVFCQNGMQGHVVGWWPSNPAEPIRGAMVSNLFQMAMSNDPSDPWPLPSGAVHPERLTEVIRDLRFHPSELDEKQIRPFIPHAEEVDQENDSRLAACATMLSECTSVHAAATFLAQNVPWDYMAVYYDAIDHFCHAFMKYHPPRQSHVSERDFRLYGNVVEAAYRYHDMMLATWLSIAGPETTILLLSDHGFNIGQMRLEAIPLEPAAPAAEHRDLGIFVMAGPGIKRDERIYGATLLDICPTLLTIAGLPVGRDMDGRPLVEAWESAPAVDSIESWENVLGETGQHPPETKLDPRESQQAIEQLVDLGYIERPDADVETAIRKTVRELNFNLAQSYMDADRHGEAIEILLLLHEANPDDSRFAMRLALCYRAMDQIDKLEPLVAQMRSSRAACGERALQELYQLAQQIKARLDESDSGRPETEAIENTDADVNAENVGLGGPGQAAESLLSEVFEKASLEERQRIRTLVQDVRINPYSFDYLDGYVLLAKGETHEAIKLFRRAEQCEPDRPWLPIQIGEAYLQIELWDDAATNFQRALSIDGENAYAYSGLARSYLGRNMYREAADAALSAVGLLHHFPLAHYLLGEALQRMGEPERAAEALEVACSLNPNFFEAHRRLETIYRERLQDTVKADEHRQLARQSRHSAELRRELPKRIVGIATGEVAEANSWSQFTAPIPNRPALHAGICPTRFVTVVTGLPRSGTSMMMQMLEAGGLPALSDGRRSPDADNPRGYFEYEMVTKLREDSSWLVDARGKSVKVVAQLLPHLPRGAYRVIFMDRSLDEVIRSQRRMLARHGKLGARLTDDRLKEVFEKQLGLVAKLLAESTLPVLKVDYLRCVETPGQVADEVNRFLGGGLYVEQMIGAVDPALYRERADSTVQS